MYSICGKTRWGQQCIFENFLTKLSGVDENLGVDRHQKGVKPPTNQALGNHYTTIAHYGSG